MNQQEFTNQKELWLPAEPDIDKDPAKYVNVYSIHSLLRRLWDVPKIYKCKGFIDPEAMEHYAIFIYSTLSYKIGDKVINSREIDLDTTDITNAKIVSNVNTEIVPDIEKLFAIINDFYKESTDTLALLSKLKEEKLVSELPSNVLAIAEKKYGDNETTKRISYIDYPLIVKDEITVLNELLDQRDNFTKAARDHNHSMEIDISWTNYFYMANHDGKPYIHGPAFIKNARSNINLHI